ncbi:MAG: iron-sulfur cluster assembly accessory protein [Pseudomonadota bacterium]
MTAETFDPSDPKLATVSLTPEAEAHIAEQIQLTARRNIRLGVRESGCNGFMYTLDYIDDPAADDQPAKTSADGAWQLFVRRADLAFVAGTEIVLEVSGLNRSLKFRNPNAESHCGCGESFSVATAS